MEQSRRPTMLTLPMIQAAITSKNFFIKFPEFNTLQPQMQILKYQPIKRCSSCGKRRIMGSVIRDFVYIVQMLNVEQLTALKKYFNAEALLLHARNKLTNKYEKIIL